MQRSIDRAIGRRPLRLIVHRSLIAPTSRTISYYGSRHRYSPIVRDSATTRTDRSRYATAAGYRSKHCRSVAPRPNRNQSHDREIERSDVTVALGVRNHTPNSQGHSYVFLTFAKGSQEIRQIDC